MKPIIDNHSPTLPEFRKGDEMWKWTAKVYIKYYNDTICKHITLEILPILDIYSIMYFKSQRTSE